MRQRLLEQAHSISPSVLLVRWTNHIVTMCAVCLGLLVTMIKHHFKISPPCHYPCRGGTEEFKWTTPVFHEHGEHV